MHVTIFSHTVSHYKVHNKGFYIPLPYVLKHYKIAPTELDLSVMFSLIVLVRLKSKIILFSQVLRDV